MEVVENRWPEIELRTDIPKREVLKCVKFCLNSSYRQYETNFYLQITSCPMGNSLSSILAELVMYFLESSILKNNPKLQV